MIETKESTIDGHVISVTQFPGRRALSYKMRLMKLLGPSIAQLFLSKNISASLKEMDLSVLAGAFEKLSSELDENEFVKFVLELLQCTRTDGREIKDAEFDNEFAGNLLHMYKILWFTLEVNYGRFFGEEGIGKILSIKVPVPKLTETKTQLKSSRSSTQ